MRILIVGAGIVGYNLAQELSQEGHDIAIVDQDPERIRRITDTLDVMAVEGNACLPSVLVKAGIKSSAMLIAVTEKDEINLLSCFLASRFNVSKRFARLRHMEFTNQERIFSPEELFIDHAINPGQIIVETILKILATPGVVSVAEFAGGEVLLREFDVPENAPIAGKSIQDIRNITQMDSFLIVAIVRGGELVIPKDQDVLQAGDRFYTLIDKEFLPFFLPMLNRTMDQVEKIIIYGATSTSTQLAMILEENMRDVCIIEPSREKAHRAADQLERTVVLHGSGTDMDLFNEINMKDADFFLALSHDDENNILSALLAKKYGAKRALVITHDPEYLPILDSIGMDITINPRLITVSAILKHLRKGQVMSVFKLIEDAEVMEIGVEEDSFIANKLIGKINFPKGAIIGALLRQGEMLLPNDEVTIEAGDSVIVVALPGTIEKIEKLFGRKRSFLPFR
ncbi:MAG: Trk system potassium transporter TrkA [Nitrospinae bacterium]|nr:Trk system potassium transporter TrkA [Nitrospinota bacterium]MBL7020803.1 Trk system potassium transporter TrkA [Nitrospinaceae bacterium]